MGNFVRTVGRAAGVSLAAFALSFVISCNKTSPDPGVTPEPEPELGPGVFRVFSEQTTKTTISDSTSTGRTVLWSTGDKVKVFLNTAGTSYNVYRVPSGGSASASIVLDQGSVDNETGRYWAVYPSDNEGAACKNNQFTVTIPSEQTYTADTIDPSALPMVAYCGSDRNLKFQIVGCVLKLVPGYVDGATEFKGLKIKKITLTAKDDCMSGTMKVKWGSEIYVDRSGGNASVSIDCGDGVDPDTPVYMVVAPGDHLAKTDNITIEILLCSGSYTETYTKTISSEVLFRRAYCQYTRVHYNFLNSLELVDLSAEETANCYIVNNGSVGKTGSAYPYLCRFSTETRGNGQATSGYSTTTNTAANIASVEKYYADNVDAHSTPFAKESGFIDETLGSGGYLLTEDGKYVYFKVDDNTIGTSLVSIKNSSGTVLWSWHIWSNKSVTEQDTGNSDIGTLLSYNLGAHQLKFDATGFNGYYYQWGRKDPILQAWVEYRYVPGTNSGDPFSVNKAAQASVTVDATIQNPAALFQYHKPLVTTSKYDWWDTGCTSTGTDKTGEDFGGKTMFDPCPPGYHVMSTKAVKALGTIGSYSERIEDPKGTLSARMQFTTSGPYVWFPWSSRRYASGYIAEATGDRIYYGDVAYYNGSRPSSGSTTTVMTAYIMVSVGQNNIDPAMASEVRCQKE